MNLNGIYYDHQSTYCQKFWTSHFNVMYSMSMSTQIFFTRIRYHNLILCFSILWPYYGTVYDRHGIILHYGLLMTCMLPYISMEILWLSSFHRSPYLTLYEFHVFWMVVSPGTSEIAYFISSPAIVQESNIISQQSIKKFFSVQIWDLRTWRKAVPWWFLNCASELIEELGLLLSGLALVDFGCIQLCCLSVLVSPWIPCSYHNPFCVWRKCHDSQPGFIQLLASLFLLKVFQFNRIVWGSWFGTLCSLVDCVFLLFEFN